MASSPAQIHASSRRLMRRRFALAAVILVAVALRAYDLTGQSLWSDEDITLDRARLPLHQMLRSLPVEHGPLYFTLVRGWTLLAGDSDFSLRWPSLLAGAICVPLAFSIGRRLVSKRTAWYLAWITACSPFLVSYGQEARMYTLLHALGLASLVAALAATHGTGPRDHTSAANFRRPIRALRFAAPWALAGAAAALAFLTHYYGALASATLAAWTALDITSQRAEARRRMIWGWAMAAAAAALLALPWLPRAMGVFDHPGWREPAAATHLPARLLVAASAQTAVTALRPAGNIEIVAAVLYGLLALGGLLVLGRTLHHGGRSLHVEGPTGRAGRALLLVGVPTVLVILLVVRNPDIHPRYLMASITSFHLCVAAGAAALPRLARGTALLALTVAAVPTLLAHYEDPAARKQDYRHLVETVLTAAEPSDSILLLDGPSFGLTQRYLPADSPLRLENLRSSTNRSRREDGTATFHARLEELAGRRTHLWLASDGEAEDAADHWLSTHLFPVSTLGLQDVTLRRYYAPRKVIGDAGSLASKDGAGSVPESASPVQPAPGSALLQHPGGTAPLQLVASYSHTVSAGSVLPVTFHWAIGDGWSDSAPSRWPHRVSLRLVDDAGEIRAIADRDPVDGTLPTTAWPHAPGATVTDRHGLLLPDGMRPGSYGLSLHFYDGATMTDSAIWHLDAITVTSRVIDP